MSNKRVKVIGIDFGTANTYVCEFSLDPQTGEKVRALDFGYDQVGSIPSSILYRENKVTVIGKRAEDEWGESTFVEKRNYTFKTHFKPEILVNKEAGIDTVNFFKILQTKCISRNIDIFDKNNIVIFGVPAETEPVYQKSFEKLIREAGFKNFQLVYEPLGALVHHLHYGDISPSEAEKGILVIDFGGGTCDFTYMLDLRADCIWGERTYGGRLFDDLFFQWYAEQNTKQVKQLRTNNDEYYVRWILCRKAKEYFSDIMHTDRSDSFNYLFGNIDHYGSLKELTWKEFVDKSSSYKCGKTLKNSLEISKKTNNNSVDLIEWFKNILLDGLKQNNIKNDDVVKVVLTGGSSQWPFVKDSVNEIFHSENKQSFILRSQNPKSAISEGLVILPYLKNKLESTSLLLKKDLNNFVDSILIEEIKNRLFFFFQNISNQINDRFIECFKDNINNYKKKGGSVEWFEEKIIGEFAALKTQLEETTFHDIDSLNRGIQDFVHSEINKWFVAHGIKYFGKTFGDTVNLDHTGHKEAFDIYSKIYLLIECSLECMLTALIASLCGGKGIALIAAGPIGLIIGAAVGLILSFLVLKYGRNKTKKQLKKIHISPVFIKVIFTRYVVNYLIKKQKKKLAKEAEKSCSDIITSFCKKIKVELKDNIGKAISKLTLLNQV